MIANKYDRKIVHSKIDWKEQKKELHRVFYKKMPFLSFTYRVKRKRFFLCVFPKWVGRFYLSSVAK